MIHVIFILTLIIIRYFIFLLRIIILISFHPIFIGILILILCLFISIMISFLTHSWLSFLMFYLISGGILILLIYISCYRFNPVFKKRLFLVVISLFSCLFILKGNFFVFKKRFSTIMFIEAGTRLRYYINLNTIVIISFLIFLCFFNVRKILTSITFSMRKLFLRRNTGTANSCLYVYYLLISR